jgi:hypothetical protein
MTSPNRELRRINDLSLCNPFLNFKTSSMSTDQKKKNRRYKPSPEMVFQEFMRGNRAELAALKKGSVDAVLTAGTNFFSRSTLLIYPERTRDVWLTNGLELIEFLHGFLCSTVIQDREEARKIANKIKNMHTASRAAMSVAEWNDHVRRYVNDLFEEAHRAFSQNNDL